MGIQYNIRKEFSTANLSEWPAAPQKKDATPKDGA